MEVRRQWNSIFKEYKNTITKLEIDLKPKSPE